MLMSSHLAFFCKILGLIGSLDGNTKVHGRCRKASSAIRSNEGKVPIIYSTTELRSIWLNAQVIPNFQDRVPVMSRIYRTLEAHMRRRKNSTMNDSLQVPPEEVAKNYLNIFFLISAVIIMNSDEFLLVTF